MKNLKNLTRYLLVLSLLVSQLPTIDLKSLLPFHKLTSQKSPL